MGKLLIKNEWVTEYSRLIVLISQETFKGHLSKNALRVTNWRQNISYFQTILQHCIFCHCVSSVHWSSINGFVLNPSWKHTGCFTNPVDNKRLCPSADLLSNTSWPSVSSPCVWVFVLYIVRIYRVLLGGYVVFHSRFSTFLQQIWSFFGGGKGHGKGITEGGEWVGSHEPGVGREREKPLVSTIKTQKIHYEKLQISLTITSQRLKLKHPAWNLYFILGIFSHTKHILFGGTEHWQTGKLEKILNSH